MKGVSISTTHNAHICITVAKGRSSHANYDEVDSLAKEIVSSLQVEDGMDIPNVDIDPEFCCNALTEVGLYGHDLSKVTEAATAIANAIEAHQDYILVEI
jgi:hypothetical protein